MRTNEEYKNLEAERDALAARVAAMREALGGLVAWAYDLKRQDPVSDLLKARKALATPDDSAAILARHDASIWLEAADVCERISDEYREREGYRYPELKTDAEAGASDCEAALRARAAELGKAHGPSV